MRSTLGLLPRGSRETSGGPDLSPATQTLRTCPSNAQQHTPLRGFPHLSALDPCCTNRLSSPQPPLSFAAATEPLALLEPSGYSSPCFHLCLQVHCLPRQTDPLKHQMDHDTLYSAISLLRAKSHKTTCDLWPHDLLARHTDPPCCSQSPASGPSQGAPSQSTQVATRLSPFHPPDHGRGSPFPGRSAPKATHCSPLGPSLKAVTTTCLAWLPPPGQKTLESRVSSGSLLCPALSAR